MLIAFQVTLQLVREVRPVVAKIRQHDSKLAKQLVDAINSAGQNISEGERKRGGVRRHAFDIASGEANEARGSLLLAVAWGWIDEDTPALKTVDRLGALLWGLTH